MLLVELMLCLTPPVVTFFWEHQSALCAVRYRISGSNEVVEVQGFPEIY